MNRRSFFGAGFVAGAGALAAQAAPASTSTSPGSVPRVVYHLSDLDKVQFVLGNIRHHIDGMGGAENIRLAVVVHGPPLRAFQADTLNAAIRADTKGLRQAGVAFIACMHTLEALRLTVDALLPGFTVAEKGGVVRLAELQGSGWLYLRP